MLRYCHLVWSNKKKGQGPLKGPFKGPLDAPKGLKQAKMTKIKAFLSICHL